ncbi:type I polyketide synthase [Streptomyces sp. NPDC059104]|uniref:type I polyketide synthase n=1 Tax=Streptomyces sp. NPDC059104 TaxID=3346729 RepID=UPI00368897EC
MHEEEHTNPTDIAVIGMAGRFPGADSVTAFWDDLRAGREATRFLTEEELLAAGVTPETLADPHYVRAVQGLADISRFDAEHFGIPADEAEILDPQHRLFLECSAAALEDAGCDPASYDGAIGVYAGAGANTYLRHQLGERWRTATVPGRYRLSIANDKDFLATRVAHRLDLRGPAIGVSTACSTSLVALHTAVLGLLAGDCDVALAGAVHLVVPHGRGYTHHNGMIFSPDGRCRTFDRAAGGTVVGEGVAAVVLKPLALALEDGDFVHAVIKGTAVNNDGSGKIGYTAPGIEGQARVIRAALDAARCTADSLSYVEAHGTATSLGDPAEVAALNEVFGPGTPRSCALGSVKTNIGHLDVAAGMAGLIKTVLMLRHRELVPSLHFQEANPKIDFDAGPFYVNTRHRAWTQTGRPLRAGVSSFGIGGTNAHVILEEPPVRPNDDPCGAGELLVLSATTPTALHRMTQEIADHLREHPDLPLGEVARTLAEGRTARPYRRALVAKDLWTAALGLPLTPVMHAPEHEPGLLFVLDDRISCPRAPLADLYEESGVFRAAVDACLDTAHPGPADGRSALSAEDRSADFVGQYALACLWRSWGVEPQAIVGTGTGEWVAAALAGVLSPRRALDAMTTGGTPTPLRAREIPVLSRSERPCEGNETPLPGQTDESWAQVATGRARVIRLAVCPTGYETGTDAAGLRSALLTKLGDLWSRGRHVDWRAVFADGNHRRVQLPTYPFERRRYWAEPGTAAQEATFPKSAAESPGPEDAAAPSLTRFVQDAVAEVLALRPGSLPDPDVELPDLGLDSLATIELVADLAGRLECDLPMPAPETHTTIRDIAEAFGRCASHPHP